MPLISLLDADGRIDPALYPNFAALAGESRWFRNASAVAEYTSFALFSRDFREQTGRGGGSSARVGNVLGQPARCGCVELPRHLPAQQRPFFGAALRDPLLAA